MISLLAISLGGCFIVKEEIEEDIAPSITLSPKPSVTMSETLVRSTNGDMIAFLPQDWFFVDLEDKVSSDVFAVAVNPDYTLSAVFSIIKKNDKTDELVTKEGLIGLARSSLQQKQKKSGDAVKLFGKYTIMNMGTLSFCKYNFSSTSGALTAQSAVFVSSLKQYYEFSLIPMNVNGKHLPPQTDIDKIFSSVLTTIQY
jgi:hypothetical protein